MSYDGAYGMFFERKPVKQAYCQIQRKEDKAEDKPP